MVQLLLQSTSIDLKNGTRIPELTKFKEHFHEYNIMVYAGFHCDTVMYEGQLDSEKRINQSFDEFTQHYHVIANLTVGMAKRYICETCNKGCSYEVVHTCEQTFSDCIVSPPCVTTGIRIPCDLCNRHIMESDVLR